MKQSPVLADLLFKIRGHEGFRELLAAVDRPRIHPFVKSKAADVERTRAEWIFESGQLAQHEAWLVLLSGSADVQENT